MCMRQNPVVHAIPRHDGRFSIRHHVYCSCVNSPGRPIALVGRKGFGGYLHFRVTSTVTDQIRRVDSGDGAVPGEKDEYGTSSLDEIVG